MSRPVKRRKKQSFRDRQSRVEKISSFNDAFAARIFELLGNENNAGRFDTLPEKLAPVPQAALAALIAAYRFKENNKCSVLVMPDDRSAAPVFETLDYFNRTHEYHDRFLFFPSWGIMPFSYSKPDPEKEYTRARTLGTLLSADSYLVVTSVEALYSRIAAPERFKASVFKLYRSQQIDPLKIREYLSEEGYELTPVVESPGEFSVKGGVIDIYSPGGDPVRLDFFGDEIESIRYFNPVTQKSFESVEQVALYPRRDLPFHKEESDKLQALCEKHTDLHIPPVISTEGGELAGYYDLFAAVMKTGTLSDYLDENVEITVFNPSEVNARIENFTEELDFLYKRNEERIRLSPSELFLGETELKDFIRGAKELSTVPRDIDTVRSGLSEAPSFRGRISQMVERLSGDQYREKTILMSMSHETQKDRLEHILSAYPERAFSESVVVSPLSEGFEGVDFVILTEHEIFGRNVKISRVSKKTTEVIESFVDLKEGDTIVHVNYGIGRFVRLKRMKAAGHERDFLELEFAGSDKLYVPLDQLNLVHRYIGSSENPRLDHLGKKSSWEKTRARVQESIEQMAGQLLELYARRESMRGIPHPPDTRFQEEFEALFAFEETDHQLAAIVEVKKDMESERPMDRLVCGDVGFGKTEVAIRAAFKAVMAGRQVAILCPTTILTFQHYHTFRQRFEGYPVEIDFMSRFRSPAENKRTKTRLKDGKVDIVIGTHSLLASDIEFNQLGLLVIDEEQRFGVKHKEAIREMKTNIDTLTLTATPIPRTLHMSLAGIRDLSLIETPPANRRQIETYVLEEDDEILRRALKIELERGGQVYVLHNRVKTIDAQASRISSMLPAARVGVLHGKMNEDEIEMIMLDFYRHRYDILVATTIIESGIDIPNVNTLVVMDATHYGLSQLYQIKGRVGRSDRQAYAYFFYPANLSLTEIAQKRLNTLQEYDQLGAGFRIAMKDLEIRGAGNILGKEQSGDIMDVGFELYLQMLHERVSEMKNEEKQKDDFTCRVNLTQDFYFPDSYISDTRQKMEFYKKMASRNDLEALNEVADEMHDRFGEMPPLVKSMMLAEEIRILGNKLKLDQIETDNGIFILTASPETTVSMQAVTSLVSNDDRFSLDPDDPRKIAFKARSTDFNEQLKEFRMVLDYLQ